MAIIRLRDGKPISQKLDCALCGRRIEPNAATAGLSDGDGQQYFACNGHFRNSRQFIVGWADFMATQRAARVRSEFLLDYGEGLDAWTLR
jgi:hypothetical protein